MNEKNLKLRFLEFFLICDIIYFMMEVVTFSYESRQTHYEELKLRYHPRSPKVNPYLLRKTLKFYR